MAMVISTMIFLASRFSRKSFKLAVMKSILKKKIEMYQNGELVTMAQYPYCCIKENKN